MLEASETLFKTKFGLFKLDKTLIEVEVKVPVSKKKLSFIYMKFKSLLVKRGAKRENLKDIQTVKKKLKTTKPFLDTFKDFVSFYILTNPEEFKVKSISSVKCSPRLGIDCKEVKSIASKSAKNLFDLIFEMRLKLSRLYKLRLAYDPNVERRMELDLIKKLNTLANKLK